MKLKKLINHKLIWKIIIQMLLYKQTLDQNDNLLTDSMKNLDRQLNSLS